MSEEDKTELGDEEEGEIGVGFHFRTTYLDNNAKASELHWENIISFGRKLVCLAAIQVYEVVSENRHVIQNNI